MIYETNLLKFKRKHEHLLTTLLVFVMFCSLLPTTLDAVIVSPFAVSKQW